MKKILSAFVLCAGLGYCMAPAHADEWRRSYSHHGYRGNGYGWVVPGIIGGVIGYELARPRQPDVVVVQPPYQAPYGYHYETILDANCNCYRNVLVQN